MSAPYQRLYATRKSQDYRPRAPGDLVQVDSANVRWYDSLQATHTSARDYISRWDVLGVYGRATAATARDTLGDLIAPLLFELSAIQVDSGSEFQG